MTAQEKLAEIKGNQLGRACSDDGALPKWYYEIEYLIARVEKLTEALGEIRDTNWSSEQVNPLKYIARKALGEDV